MKSLRLRLIHVIQLKNVLVIKYKKIQTIFSAIVYVLNHCYLDKLYNKYEQYYILIFIVKNL